VPCVAACTACGKEFKAPLSALSRLKDAQANLHEQFAGTNARTRTLAGLDLKGPARLGRSAPSCMLSSTSHRSLCAAQPSLSPRPSRPLGRRNPCSLCWSLKSRRTPRPCYGRLSAGRFDRNCYIAVEQNEASVLTGLIKTNCNRCYLLQRSLTIFRLATRMSPYSSLFDAFSTSPSFFSFFSSALDSLLAEPVTVTLWPT